MVDEIKRQLEGNEKILNDYRPGVDGHEPDYDKCIEISTNSSLKYMVPPGILVIFDFFIKYLF